MSLELGSRKCYNCRSGIVSIRSNQREESPLKCPKAYLSPYDYRGTGRFVAKSAGLTKYALLALGILSAFPSLAGLACLGTGGMSAFT